MQEILQSSEIETNQKALSSEYDCNVNRNLELVHLNVSYEDALSWRRIQHSDIFLPIDFSNVVI